MLEGAIAFAVLAVVMLGGNYLYGRRRVARQRRRLAPPPPADLGAGTFTVRQPRRNTILLAIAALFPAVLVAMLTVRAWDLGRTGVGGAVAGGVVTAIVLAFAAYQLASAFRSSLVVSDAGIERVGVFSRRLLRWEEIAKVSFNPAQHWFFVTGADGSRLWLPADVAGMAEFAVTARRRLPPAVLRADPVVREVLDELAGDAA
jgi:hypothetical protein